MLPPSSSKQTGITLGFFEETSQSLKGLLEGYGYRCYLLDSEAGILVLRPAPDDEFEPGCILDYLAVKSKPESLTRAAIRPALSVDELVQRLGVFWARHIPMSATYIATALSTAVPLTRTVRS